MNGPIHKPDAPESAHFLANCQAPAPKVYATATRNVLDNIWTLRVTCPYCGREALHGGGDGVVPIFGHRAADCDKGDGYEIAGVQS